MLPNVCLHVMKPRGCFCSGCLSHKLPASILEVVVSNMSEPSERAKLRLVFMNIDFLYLKFDTPHIGVPLPTNCQ